MKNTLEQAQHKLKQLTEAIRLMDDLDGHLALALDFCEHNSISTILDRVAAVVMDAQSELEDMETELEECIEEYEARAIKAKEDFEVENSHLLVAD